MQRIHYPNYEVIVVNDGSTDETQSIAARYPVQLITTPNQGLSQARNVGWEAAGGELVAYLDDDAYPDEDWLSYLAAAFEDRRYVGVGGPNIPPPGDGLVADAVANAPGGPVHVLLTDEVAEHIPGCNMAFRTQALRAIGGFDPQFRSAGDDVDVCWRLQHAGGTLGFCPPAMVWHHRRDSISAYWRQQKGYGQAEARLEAKWPQKYNSSGHHTFAGRIYGKGLTALLRPVDRVYHGVWGMAPFQRLYEPNARPWQSLSLMPEWYLFVALLLSIAVLTSWWAPLRWLLPLSAVAIGLSVAQAMTNARYALRGSITTANWPMRVQQYSLTTLLHLIQPVARLSGRMRGGLTLWRHRVRPGFAVPVTRTSATWTENWIAPEQRLAAIDARLRRERTIVVPGDAFSSWDLEVRGGMFGAARLLMAVEDHGAGTQYVRLRIWPRCRPSVAATLLTGAGLMVAALSDEAWPTALLFALVVAGLAARTVQQCGGALASLLRASAHERSGSATTNE